MPENTLAAVADHGEVTGDTVTGTSEEANAILDALDRLGISYAEVTDQLEREGVEKFEKSWGELLDGVTAALEQAR
jgi:transaldolase